jgi:sugar O-acyltransferase (sialic acid O-acetyltransferase NeuD family)
MSGSLNRALIGGGGHAMEVLSQMNVDLPIYVDDEYYDPQSGHNKLSDLDYDRYEIMVCVGNSKLRKSLVERLPVNARFFTYIHPTALILSDNIKIGEGSFIGAYSVLTTNIKIGKHALMNRSCHVGHDCVIGDYFSMMPGSIVSGNAKIGESVYLGTNSAVGEKLNLCDDLVVGMGAAVVRDINTSGVYVGVPAKLKMPNNNLLLL